MRVCPDCAEPINASADMCPFCGLRAETTDSVPPPTPPETPGQNTPAVDQRIDAAPTDAEPHEAAPGEPVNGKPARQRHRRAAVGAAALVAAVLAGGLLIPGARDRLPVGLPVVGRNADTVFDQLKRAGLPVAEGVPKAENFREMVRSNSCKSSRSFVRSDTEDSGWGFICVKPPYDVYRRMSDGFDDVPMLIGPLFVDDNDGEVVIFGFGWPADASKTIYDAIKGSGGTYLVEQ